MALTIVSSKVFQELWFQDEGYIFAVITGQLKCIRIANFFFKHISYTLIHPFCACVRVVLECLGACVCVHMYAQMFK